jgi:hypothetical protein
MNFPPHMLRERLRTALGGPHGSRQRRRSARLGVRSDANSRYRNGCFQPGYSLVQALKSYKNQRRRIEGDCTAMTAHAIGTAVSVVMRCPGRIRLGVRSGRHPGTEGRQIERIGRGIGDNAKRCDRRHQLHQNRQHHDWNKYFQPPPHHCSHRGDLRNTRRRICIGIFVVCQRAWLSTLPIYLTARFLHVNCNPWWRKPNHFAD